MCLTQPAIILAYNFTSEFRREMGLKLEGVVGSFLGFGNVTTYAVSISEGNQAAEAAASNKDTRMGNNEV